MSAKMDRTEVRSSKQARAHNSKPSVAMREWGVLVCGGATVIYLSWGLGGIPTRSLHTMAIMGALTFLLAIIPLPKVCNGMDGEHGNLRNLLRLLRLPGFWLALLFLGYIAVQNLNYSVEQVRIGSLWWVESVVPRFSNLPTGIRAEYEPMNGWRVLVGMAGAAALVHGMWVGLRRRQSVVAMLWLFVFSGVGMAVVGMLQFFTGAEAVLWRFPSENPSFWGSFFYRNQAAGYLNLVLCAAGFLFFYHSRRTVLEERGSGPHLLFGCFLSLIFASIAMSLSRGGFLVASGILLIFLVLLLMRFIFAHESRQNWIISLIIIVLLAGGSWSSVRYVDWDSLFARFEQINLEDMDNDTRSIATRATLDMAQERILMGWGAGSFRYVFPKYQKKYPKIFYLRYHPRKGGSGMQFFRHAHNDLAQSLAEYGIIGCALLVGLALFWLGWLLVAGWRFLFAVGMIYAGILGAAGHAMIEFIFQSPSYLFAFAFLLVGSTQLMVLESRRRFRH
jgi:O-antigen ligase